MFRPTHPIQDFYLSSHLAFSEQSIIQKNTDPRHLHILQNHFDPRVVSHLFLIRTPPDQDLHAHLTCYAPSSSCAVLSFL